MSNENWTAWEWRQGTARRKASLGFPSCAVRPCTNDDEDKDEDKDDGDKNDDAVIGFQILGHTGHFFFLIIIMQYHNNT